MENILYVGIDVDDNAFNCSLVDNITDKTEHFVCKPDVLAFVKQLKKINKEKAKVKVCYEATYLGYSLYRDLLKHKIECDVVAPSLIPEIVGKKQKTDRLDSMKLASFYMKGLLTPVHIPSASEEADRSLLRSRRFIVEQVADLKNHINSICRKLGLHYHQETGKAELWTQVHIKWLEKVSKERQLSSDILNFKMLLRQLEEGIKTIELYDTEIEHLAEKEEYKEKVDALISFRGIKTESAMTLITEIGDVTRFSHPEKLTSYAGLDIAEYSSGGKEKKYGISKTGNKYIRTVVVESSQYSFLPVKVSKNLSRRRAGVPEDVVKIADRCMARLHKKGNRLLHGGKPRNKVKVANAREFLSFIWEALTKVSTCGNRKAA